MSASAERVQTELQSLGYETWTFESTKGIVVAFNYEIEAGSYKGKTTKVGVSFQEEGYPEYPPHWVHVSPPLSDGRGGVAEEYTDSNGKRWLAMSRPPGDKWDSLPTKHMLPYLNEHLRRIWADI